MTEVQVLDHGYVKLCETWGRGTMEPQTDNEVGVICAARMSTQGSFRGWAQDEKLLRYLWTHKHASPFEFAGAIFEVQLPIFVAREWMRHRAFSYNEMSARYAPLPNLYYIPSVERLLANASTGNKQAGVVQGAQVLTHEAAVTFRQQLVHACESFEETYQASLANGVPKELARLGMPVNRYTRVRVCGNLRNWIESFLRQRTAPEAQWEIQQYAQAVQGVLCEQFPRTLALFTAAP